MTNGHLKKAHPGIGGRQMSALHKANILARGSMQRLHPGMSSSLSHATAHYGAVTGLKATRDGMYLLSSGELCWICLDYFVNTEF